MVSSAEWGPLVRSCFIKIDSPRSEKYWHQKARAMPHAEIKGVRDAKLSALVSYIYDNSLLYHRKFDQGRIKPMDIRSADDIRLKHAILSAKLGACVLFTKKRAEDYRGLE